ncbi:type II toxin-antitoxin system HicB family antitoxin [Geomesophilobacter sediminis]|uniref:Type II toxin-antitoxin system HicB family antitoxin n=1 Tax=Geomesophilobacter sediminis TaxID=2798584 RepID=A0A8J7LUQ6_9BACT|nr:type II toxin-antitoxin system HicB family antitoxin [Geomesophilobacter sediminis]MBJ6724934.1 type II toxin-antitoxin system HicB family antitoxin [Geomesophilobacter sediminis]
MMILAYPIHLEPAEEGGFVVTFPDIPEAITQGEDRDDALAWAQEALESALEVYQEKRLPVPNPSPPEGRPVVVLPVVATAKLILHNTLLESGKKKADLARLLNIAPTLVDRLLSFRHKSRIEQIEAALAVLGKKLVLDVIKGAEKPITTEGD